jgi:Arc/MetJ-type ribon-helix-helix transcriptional regulator
MNIKTKTKKATFNLSPEILTELDKAMSEGAAPSKNALVERALDKELKEIRRQARKVQWQKAAKDSALLKDISEVESAFKFADAETAGSMDR